MDDELDNELDKITYKYLIDIGHSHEEAIEHIDSSKQLRPFVKAFWEAETEEDAPTCNVIMIEEDKRH